MSTRIKMEDYWNRGFTDEELTRRRIIEGWLLILNNFNYYILFQKILIVH